MVTPLVINEGNISNKAEWLEADVKCINSQNARCKVNLQITTHTSITHVPTYVYLPSPTYKP